MIMFTLWSDTAWQAYEKYVWLAEELSQQLVGEL